jgi:hypothetical protein
MPPGARIAVAAPGGAQSAFQLQTLASETGPNAMMVAPFESEAGLQIVQC